MNVRLAALEAEAEELAAVQEWSYPGRLTCSVKSLLSSFPAKITRSWSAGTASRCATTSFSWRMLASDLSSTGKPWLELNLTNTKKKKQNKKIKVSISYHVHVLAWLWKACSLASESVHKFKRKAINTAMYHFEKTNYTGFPIAEYLVTNKQKQCGSPSRVINCREQSEPKGTQLGSRPSNH